MVTSPELVIFDCDGVLVDSEGIATRVLVEEARTLGLDLPIAEGLELFRGEKMARCVATLEGRLGRSVPQGFVLRVRERMSQAFTTELRAVDGVKEVLAGVSVPTCVASSGPLEKIRLSLRLTGLLEYFDGHLFSAYEINSWKPAPDLFLHAARVMGAVPNACVVVEDSLPGVRAGVAAGMRVLAFAEGALADRLAAEGGEVFGAMRQLSRLLSL
jgi:HAD superfamily hydrolase (TIGR01509 family)